MTTTYKAKKYTIDEIMAGGYNLDLCGYPTEERLSCRRKKQWIISSAAVPNWTS